MTDKLRQRTMDRINSRIEEYGALYFPKFRDMRIAEWRERQVEIYRANQVLVNKGEKR